MGARFRPNAAFVVFVSISAPRTSDCLWRARIVLNSSTAMSTSLQHVGCEKLFATNKFASGPLKYL
jgi:hypothetical protein